jgi:PhoH-like ATPase
MQKTFVLDTNVLIQSPHSLSSFADNTVVLPVVCLEELDKLKNDDGDTGFAARECIRFLEKLRLKGNLLEGVELDNGGLLRIETNDSSITLPKDFDDSISDNRILKVCKGLQEKSGGAEVILITRDILVRLKAQILDIETQDFIAEQSPKLNEQYTGRASVYASSEAMLKFNSRGIDIDEIYTMENNKRVKVTPVPNEFFIVCSDTSEGQTVIGRLEGKFVVPLEHRRKEPFGVVPRNVGQKFLQEALMESAKKAPLVIVKGPAGTAKTFYSLAVGLDKTMEPDSREYRRILITRPNVQFDEEIGFLPGTEQEKISPLMRPIIDNLEILMDFNEKYKDRSERSLSEKIERLFERGIIFTEAMNYIRGRTINNTFLIIDEAQNLTPKQAKAIITRVSMGTKVVLLGDPQQIDNPLLDERTNGLSYAGEKMKGSPLCYQITMQQDECERSPLAFDAARRM